MQDDDYPFETVDNDMEPTPTPKTGWKEKVSDKLQSIKVSAKQSWDTRQAERAGERTMYKQELAHHKKIQTTKAIKQRAKADAMRKYGPRQAMGKRKDTRPSFLGTGLGSGLGEFFQQAGRSSGYGQKPVPKSKPKMKKMKSRKKKGKRKLMKVEYYR